MGWFYLWFYLPRPQLQLIKERFQFPLENEIMIYPYQLCFSISFKAQLIKPVNSPDPTARLHLVLLLKD